MTAQCPRVWVAAGLVATALLAGACSSSSESPWAANDPAPADLPPPPEADDAPAGDTANEADSTPIHVPAAVVSERECYLDEARCGLVSLPQVAGSPDLIDVEFRIISETGGGTPLVQLLAGADEFFINTEDFPDRPLVLIGSRGSYPGGPHISCPEFWAISSASEVGPATAACNERLTRAGIDLSGTLPSSLGLDVGATLVALGFEEVDLIVPSWRAPTASAVAASIDVRRVVYSEPWFGSSRAAASNTSLHASTEAVWERCNQLAGCTTAGTIEEFFRAVEELDDAPLDDVADEFSDEPVPIDSGRLLSAIFSNSRLASDLVFLPRLHQAIISRDASTVSEFVQSTYSDSPAVNTLSTSCSLTDPDDDNVARLPPLLRIDALDNLRAFADGCAHWPVETIDDQPPRGLTVFTRSTSTDGSDYRVASASGAVIIEPTVGPPTPACLITAARAWIDDEQVDDTECSTPLPITGRNNEIRLVDDIYTVDEFTIELLVPESWTGSGNGTWWREADPVDPVNLDVYLWRSSDNAETSRREIVEEWRLLDAELTEVTAGGATWLEAEGSDEYGDHYRVSVASIDGEIIALILRADIDEIDLLVDSLLGPTRASVTLR